MFENELQDLRRYKWRVDTPTRAVFTVDDARMFTMPWSGAITYEKPAMEWEEIVCADNPFDFFAEKNGASVPTASKPDF